jgi:predicted transcriptional regulator
MATWHDHARRLAAEGKSNVEIAQRFGVNASAVWKALNPDRAREIRRRDNSRPQRSQAKRAWDREHDRSPEGRGVCEICGEPKGIGCRSGKRCQSCYRAEITARQDILRTLYEEGVPIAEIAYGLEINKESISVLLIAMRKRGEDIPLRRPWKQKVRA